MLVFWKTIANLDVKSFGRAFVQYAFWSSRDDFMTGFAKCLALPGAHSLQSGNPGKYTSHPYLQA